MSTSKVVSLSTHSAVFTQSAAANHSAGVRPSENCAATEHRVAELQLTEAAVAPNDRSQLDVQASAHPHSGSDRAHIHERVRRTVEIQNLLYDIQLLRRK